MGFLTLVVLLLAGSPAAGHVEAGAGRAMEIATGTPLRPDRTTYIFDGTPHPPETVEESVKRWSRIRTASFRGWLPGGGVLVATRFGDVMQAHVVREPGGVRSQATFREDSPVDRAVSLRGGAVPGFLHSDRPPGGGLRRLLFHDLRTGDTRPVAVLDLSDWTAACANTSARCAFSTAMRNGRDWDLYVVNAGSPGRTEPLMTDGGAWSPVEWSRDDARLLAARHVAEGSVLFGKRTLYSSIDVVTKEMVPIGTDAPDVRYGDAAFAPDGQAVFIASDEESDVLTLRRHDLATGIATPLTASIPWDVEEVEVSGDGRFLAFTTNEDGIDRLHVWRLPGMEPVALPALPEGRLRRLSFPPGGHVLGFDVGAPGIPGDVFSLDPDDGRLVRWTHSETNGLERNGFVVPERIRYETFDRADGARRTIPALRYRPKGTGPFPVLVAIHGGPADQETVAFNAFHQYLVAELGVAVLLPNVRGSTGYGNAYARLDDGFLREDAVKDVGALLDWIASQPDLDEKRVAILGGSYGGYVALASMIRYGGRLSAGIAASAISGFTTYLDATARYRLESRRAEYGDERDPETRAFLERISPIREAGKIRRPLLVVHGLRDERVPASEGEQIVRAVRSNGTEVWFLKAVDEGHGIRDRAGRELYHSVVAHFLLTHLAAG